jgi:hypothetical protein
MPREMIAWPAVEPKIRSTRASLRRFQQPAKRSAAEVSACLTGAFTGMVGREQPRRRRFDTAISIQAYSGCA